MERSFCFLNYHFGPTSDQDGDSFTVGAFFNDKHFFVSSAEVKFFDSAGFSEFLRGDLLESRDDASSSGHGDEFDVYSSNPPDCWKFILKQKVISLIFEAPLAKGDVAAIFFEVIDHVCEVLLFQLIQFVEALS